LETFDRVLRLRENDAKALHRKGKILHQRNQLDEALELYSKAIKALPSNQTIREDYQKAKEEREAFRKKEKEMYRTMLQGASRDDDASKSFASTASTGPLSSNALIFSAVFVLAVALLWIFWNNENKAN